MGIKNHSKHKRFRFIQKITNESNIELHFFFFFFWIIVLKMPNAEKLSNNFFRCHYSIFAGAVFLKCSSIIFILCLSEQPDSIKLSTYIIHYYFIYRKSKQLLCLNIVAAALGSKCVSNKWVCKVRGYVKSNDDLPIKSKTKNAPRILRCVFEINFSFFVHIVVVVLGVGFRCCDDKCIRMNSEACTVVI